jgi:hypothetical protein
MASSENRVRTTRRFSILRISIRTFLIILTVTGVWFAYVTNAARSQKLAVDRIEELGGSVAFDYQFDSKMNWRTTPKPPLPQWLINLIDEEYSRSVSIVNLDDRSDPENDDLMVFAQTTDLRQLTFCNRKRITDDGLAHLAPLSRLEVLALDGTNIQGDGLRHLANMKGIKGLALHNTPLKDDGMQYIGQLDRLEWLILNNTKITDDGIAAIASLKCLASLQIRETAITDDGLKVLAKMKSLKQVLLSDNASENGKSWLQKQLPNCTVN